MIVIKEKTTEALVADDDFDIKKVRFNLDTMFTNKPCEALWTSSWNSHKECISWIKWCLREEFKMKNTLYKITSKRKVKLYEIDNPKDYTDNQLPKKGDYIDYKKLVQLGFDGLHVTDTGAILGHLSDFEYMIRLNAFDCESTVWFNTDWIDMIEDICELNMLKDKGN